MTAAGNFASIFSGEHLAAREAAHKRWEERRERDLQRMIDWRASRPTKTPANPGHNPRHADKVPAHSNP